MGSLEKWVDELQATIDKISRKVAGALIAKITDPQDGQAIIYDATSGGWKNGDVTPPAPEPANPLLLISEGTTDDIIMILSQDGISAWTAAGVKLKSGSGTFTSYVISDGAAIKAEDYTTAAVEYTFQNNTVTQEVSLADLSLVDGVEYDFGAYYCSDSQGCYAGLIYAPKTRPQDFTLYQISAGTGASGDIVVSALSLSKPIISTKRRKTK